MKIPAKFMMNKTSIIRSIKTNNKQNLNKHRYLLYQWAYFTNILSVSFSGQYTVLLVFILVIKVINTCLMVAN